MPKVIYCLHALSSHLFKLGKAPLIHDVFGKAVFTGENENIEKNNLKKHFSIQFHISQKF